MSVRWYYQDQSGSIAEIVGRVRIAENPMSTNAQEPSANSIEILIDDSPSTFIIGGHRLIFAIEDEIEWGDGSLIWVGFTAERDFERRVERAGKQRIVKVTAYDQNVILERRILLGDDCNRSAETDFERLTWLFGKTETALITDTTYLLSDSPVDMSETDYQKQRVIDVVADCLGQSGKNAFVWFQDGPDLETDPVTFGIWYGPDDAEEFESDLRISSFLSDVDNTTTFAAIHPSTLTRTPARVYSRVVVDYDGGWVPVDSPETADLFALGGRDTTLSAPNVKTKAKAIARGIRHLRDMATEEDVIHSGFDCGPADVNRVLAGHRMQARFQTLDSLELDDVPNYYDTLTWFRVLQRTVHPRSPTEFRVDVDLSPPARDVLGIGSGGSGGGGIGGVYGILWKPHSMDTSRLVWEDPGDTPPPGYPGRPTVGLIEPIVDAGLPDNRDHTGWRVLGDGEITIAFTATWTGVLVEGTTIVTWWVTKNGVLVGQETESYVVEDVTGGTDLNGGTGRATVIVEDLPVEPGDVIEGHIAPNRLVYFFRTPQGVGIAEEQLEISSGTLI